MKNLVLAFFACLALSVIGGWSEKAMAADPAGHRFCQQGIESPEDIAKRVERSLLVKQDGSAKIERCRATAQHFLVAYQAEYPEANLTSVSQLPAFFRQMREIKTEVGTEYNADCLWTAENGVDFVKKDCVTREVEAGEKVFGIGNKRLLFSKCANPGGAEAPAIVVTARCLRVDFPSMGRPSAGKRGPAIRFAYIGWRPLPGRCNSYQLAGVAKRLVQTPEECPDTYQKMVGNRQVTVVCSWDEIEVNSTLIMKRPVEVQNVSGSFYARAEGTNSWYMDEEALNGLPTICWEMPDGSFHTLSVTREMFVNGVATITPAQVNAAVWQ